MPPPKEPRIDAYIAEAAHFARPILRHLRQLVHRGGPDTIETIKWGHPSFTLDGKILCYMAAFKAHVAFGFWGPAMHRLLKQERGSIEGAMGVMGRITSRADLPDDATMLRYVRTAIAFVRDGQSTFKRRPTRKPAARVPADLAAALKADQAAARHFADFPPSARRDYIEWITEAKQPATRARRLATTIEWVAAGKRRNWKYEHC